MREKTPISERQACRLVGISRSVLSYQSKSDPANARLSARIGELAAERRRFGYRRIHALLRREGTTANHKRVYRLYRAAGLAVQRRRKRRRIMLERQPLLLPHAPNQVWSMDFVRDPVARQAYTRRLHKNLHSRCTGTQVLKNLCASSVVQL